MKKIHTFNTPERILCYNRLIFKLEIVVATEYILDPTVEQRWQRWHFAIFRTFSLTYWHLSCWLKCVTYYIWTDESRARKILIWPHQSLRVIYKRQYIILNFSISIIYIYIFNIIINQYIGTSLYWILFILSIYL